MTTKFILWFKNNILLFCVVVVASILRLYHVDYQSVWLDEIHTLNEANPAFTFSELHKSILQSDPHPPLYFILMHFVFGIFGYTTFVLRIFSAIVGITTVIGIYKLGKEFFNKTVGQYSAILLAINYFHLTYSQEGRMYALFTLATVFSFYYLIKLIKEPSFKSVIFYTLCSTLMIYCHFFALFVLVSQYIILFFYILRPFKGTAKQFFYYTFMSGISTLLLYLPTYSIFKKAAERDTIWIPMPTIDVYTQIFKDFFGQSEIVLFFGIILILVFFVNLFKEKGSEKLYVNPEKDKMIFGFLVLFVWIGITLLIPLIRTYVALPMLISRYFICLVPAIIIIISIGLYSIRNAIVQYLILGLIIIFSITDIIIVKEYYTKINKTQFRELSDYIIKYNTTNSPVVTSLDWYFPYFLKNDQVKMNLVGKTLDVYVNEMIKDSTKKQPFWFIDAHGKRFEVSDATLKYLDKNFIVANKLNVYDGWTSYYSFISDKIEEIDISNLATNPNKAGDDFSYYIDSFNADSMSVKIKGWAYFGNQDATDSEISVVLILDGKAYKIPSYKVSRGDVATYYKVPYNLDNCGFHVNLNTGRLNAGKYRLALILKNKQTRKEGIVHTDKFLTKF